MFGYHKHLTSLENVIQSELEKLTSLCRYLAYRAFDRVKRRGFAPSFDDALQGAWLGALKAVHSYVPNRGTSITTWAYRWINVYAEQETFKSAGLSARGNGPRWAPLEDRAEPDPANDVVLRVAVRSAVRRLPERLRLVLWYLYWQGLTEAAVGAILGVSRARVRALRDRALHELRPRLI